MDELKNTLATVITYSDHLREQERREWLLKVMRANTGEELARVVHTLPFAVQLEAAKKVEEVG